MGRLDDIIARAAALASSSITSGWQLFAKSDSDLGKSSFKDEYIKGVQKLPESPTIGGAKLTSQKGLMWELGFGGGPIPQIGDVRQYDIGKMLLAAARRNGKIKRSKVTGEEYIDVKFDKSEASIAKAIDQHAASEKAKGVAHDASEGLKGKEYVYHSHAGGAVTVVKGDRLPTGLIRKSENLNRPIPFETAHKTDMLAGAFRTASTYAGSTKQANPGARLFRHLSDRSPPWIHPPIKNHNVAKAFVKSSDFRGIVEAVTQDLAHGIKDLLLGKK